MSEPTRVWMPPQPAKLERLAKELETLPENDKLKLVIDRVRDNEYPRYKLIKEMQDAKVSYFANRLKIGYYDRL